MKIQQLRFSCIWTVSLLDIMKNSRFNVEHKYVDAFKQALKTQSSEWQTPWSNSEDKWQDSLRRSFFWKNYLELAKCSVNHDDLLFKKSHEDSSRARIWTHLLPLKYKTEILVTDAKKQKIKFESFCYPFGISIVATVYIKLNSPLEEAIDNVIEARLDNHKITYDNNQLNITLQDLATKFANNLYQKVFCSQATDENLDNNISLNEPFTITTIIDAKGTKNEAFYNLSENDLIWNNLATGLCGWDKHWKQHKAIESFSVPKIISLSNLFTHSIIGTKNSRLVWFPAYFSENLEKKKTENLAKKKTKRHYPLGSYHRHLSLLSLQTEMLIETLLKYNDLSKPDHNQQYIAKRALLLLNLLNNSPVTFRSYSAAKRIQLFSKVIDIDKIDIQECKK